MWTSPCLVKYLNFCWSFPTWVVGCNRWGHPKKGACGWWDFFHGFLLGWLRPGNHLWGGSNKQCKCMVILRVSLKKKWCISSGLVSCFLTYVHRVLFPRGSSTKMPENRPSLIKTRYPTLNSTGLSKSIGTTPPGNTCKRSFFGLIYFWRSIKEPYKLWVFLWVFHELPKMLLLISKDHLRLTFIALTSAMLGGLIVALAHRR